MRAARKLVEIICVSVSNVSRLMCVPMSTERVRELLSVEDPVSTLYNLGSNSPFYVVPKEEYWA